MAYIRLSLLAAAATATLLSGCAKPGPSFADQCMSYGYQPGTRMFLDCVNARQGMALNAAMAYSNYLASTRPINVNLTRSPW